MQGRGARVLVSTWATEDAARGLQLRRHRVPPDPPHPPTIDAMRTSAELREGYLAFFESKGHMRVPSASLVPRADDRSTLLTTAGMQPMMPYFLGLEQPPAPLLTTSQKSFRTQDIEEVGSDGHHLTFFEMLGNFSFGQYFKEGAIEFARSSSSSTCGSTGSASGRPCMPAIRS